LGITDIAGEERFKSNFQFQRTVHGIIPDTCEVIDGSNSECREIGARLQGGKLLYEYYCISADTYLYEVHVLRMYVNTVQVPVYQQ
jgi:hypothetical protein